MRAVDSSSVIANFDGFAMVLNMVSVRDWYLDRPNSCPRTCWEGLTNQKWIVFGEGRCAYSAGFIGGTFDPVNGHVAMVDNCSLHSECYYPRYPNNRPPHRDSEVSATHRMEMLQLAMSHLQGIKLIN